MSQWHDLCRELNIEPKTEFTAEKQLKVIELLSGYDLNSYSYRLTDNSDLEWSLTLENSWAEGHGKSYCEALANLLTNLYPRLLEAMQQVLVRILEE